MYMSIPIARQVLESLEELVVDSDNIDFGPAIALAEERKQTSIAAMKRYIDDANKFLVASGGKPL